MKEKGSLCWKQEGKTIAGLAMLSVAARMLYIHYPSSPVYAEGETVHALTEYFRGNFFVDKTPPAARLFLFFACVLSGVSSWWSKNTEKLLLFLRVVSVLCGSTLVPLAYITACAIGCSVLAAASVGLCVLFDSGITGGTRFAMSQTFTTVFSAANVLFWCLGRRGDSRFLFCAGVFAGLTSSSKLLGLFYVLPGAVISCFDSWNMLGKNSARDILARILKKGLFLCGVPACVYFAVFWTHIALLPVIPENSGVGLSKEFQQSLIGGKTPETNKNVYYGSVIVLRQERPENGYLHSHPHGYPEGSKQQQVTLYTYKDTNNLFRVLQKNGKEEGPKDTLQPLLSGDTVRLEHVATGRYLHSHHIKAPVSKEEHNNEVSCYGDSKGNVSDTNDNWKVEIVDRNGDIIKGSKKKPVTAMHTRIRLRHVNTRARLNSNGKRLGTWGFNHLEVTCGKRTLRKNSVWVIEESKHRESGETEKTAYRQLGAFGKFAELHKDLLHMTKEEAGLVHSGVKPREWPGGNTVLLLWKETAEEENGKTVGVHVLPNRFQWKAGFFCVFLNIFFWLSSVLLGHLGVELPSFLRGDKMEGVLVAWYLLSYVPHFFLSRIQTTLDYLPSLYVSILLSGVLLERVIQLARKRHKYAGYFVSGVYVSCVSRYFIGQFRDTYGL
ncbi:MAG: uncharacterized protein A8A55_0935 [Amphiamblys sp. WSBS2006]|nr:MAG: uncharacterized protein A8A55_0935 [Amphiamblys sp. WSBS2006]